MMAYSSDLPIPPSVAPIFPSQQEQEPLTCPHCGGSVQLAEQSAEDRQKLREELSAGKKSFESTLPKTNVLVPWQFIKSGIDRK